MGKNFWCKIGFHKYGRDLMSIWGASSNVMNYRRTCKRCGHTVKWARPRDPARYD